MRVSGAELLTSVLASAGVKYVVGIPGHTVFSFANAVPGQPELTPILVRNEAAASFAADVYFRLTGNMMAVFAHSIPGAANAASGIANAYADSSAMLVITGQTAIDALGRGAYQELSRQFDGDTAQWMRHISKRVWQPRNPNQLVEHALRAIKVARSGRPGPVVLDVFQDVWDMEVDVASLPDVRGFLIDDRTRPTEESVSAAAELLANAQRPLIVAGNGVNLSRAQAELLALAESEGIPVATTVSGKGAFPEDHALSLGIVGWVGTAAANDVARRADVVLSIGCRLGESTTSSWQAGATFDFTTTKLIQSDIDVHEVATVFPVDVALIGDARLVLRDVTNAGGQPRNRDAWVAEVAGAKERWDAIVEESARDDRTPITVGRVVRELDLARGEEPVNIVGDIGKHHKWVAQQFVARAGDAVISSMGAGTMGIGPAGALGAALADNGARTIAWTGDGGMSMASYVLPTAAEYRLPITFLVIDDGAFGAVANIQMKRYGRTVFSEFTGSGTNPDYRLDLAAVAAASGVPSRRIVNPAEIRPGLHWAFAQDGPVLLDIIVDRASNAPEGGGSKLTDIWNHPVQAWARRPLPTTNEAR